jgi:hypothetical protein
LASATAPINGVITNTVANSRLRVPYLGFTPTGLQAADNQGDTKFNSLQVTLRKQMSHGLRGLPYRRASAPLNFGGDSLRSSPP